MQTIPNQPKNNLKFSPNFSEIEMFLIFSSDDVNIYQGSIERKDIVFGIWKVTP